VKRRKILDLLKWVWIAAVVIGAGYYIYRNYREIAASVRSISTGHFLLCFVFLFLGKFAVSEITRLSLKKIDRHMPYKEALTITTVTQLGKYLPGGIWHIAAKFGIYKVQGMRTGGATRVMILENYWLLSSATVIGALALLNSSQNLVCQFLPFLCQAERNFGLSVLVGLVWLASLVLVERILFPEKKIIWVDIIRTFFVLVVIWFSFGLSQWLVFPSQYASYIIPVIGVFSISWVAGYIAVFAPGGLGVRELLFTLVLSPILPAEKVLIFATFHRLLWVVAELVLGIGSQLVFGMPLEEKEPAPLK